MLDVLDMAQIWNISSFPKRHVLSGLFLLDGLVDQFTSDLEDLNVSL